MLKDGREKFLFGKVYTMVDSIEDKMDENYITEEEMNKIYCSKSEFEINKNNFLNDSYTKSSTKQTEYYLYNSSILHNEEAKGIDISEFSSGEIKDIIESVPTGSNGQQYRVFKFINQYCKWRVDKGFIPLNPCDNLDKKDFSANIEALRSKIIGLDKFWKMIDTMMAKGCHVQLALPLVLSRYGIYGDNAYDLLNLRYEQINEEEKTVTIYYKNGDFKTTLFVDDRFLNIIEKSKYENIVDSSYNAVYLDTGYVIKRSSLAGENSGDIETNPGLIRRANLAYNYIDGYSKIKFNNLVKSRKLDFIFNIRRGRKINTEDVLNVIRIFKPKSSSGSYHSLVADIESLTGEKVLFKYENGVRLIDDNASEFVRTIVEVLQFEGYELWKCKNWNKISELLNISLDVKMRNIENNITPNKSNNKENTMWIFFLNPKYWYLDDFLKSDKVNSEIYYSINKDHKDRFKIGDLGLIRVGIDSRNRSELYGKQKMESGIYAIVKVMSIPEFTKDNDSEFYANKHDINKDKWRVKIKIIKNLIDSPIIFNEKNKAEIGQDKYLINGFRRATMPLDVDVFYRVLRLINLSNDTKINRYEEIIDIKNLGNSIIGIEILNEIYTDINIEHKEKLVKVIERGKIADKIKEHLQYKCQICEALGENPYSFKKKNGEYYIETHHIIPVSDTKNSKLSVDNLICLCPNHHRQVHYGNVKIIHNNDTYVEFFIDGIQIKIDKIKLNK